ncbi:MAG: GTP cyclohydrolase I FolE [bacterium]
MKRVFDEELTIDYQTNIDVDKLKDLFTDFLGLIGEDVNREGLRDTPLRVAKSWAFLLKGYNETLSQVVNGAIFHAESSNMVVVKNIEFYSLCEHHLLPFFGVVHIGYIPDKKILGLSKFAKIVDMYARRLQIQERLTSQIAFAIQEVLNPIGVAVVVDGYHLCMMMRGVEKQNSHTISSCLVGQFKNDPKTREEFLEIIKMKNEFIG